MAAVGARVGERAGRAQGCEARAGSAGARELRSRRPVNRNTVPNQRASKAAMGKARSELCKRPRKIAITSGWAAICGRGNCPIRKKIIGHGMSAFHRRLATGNGLPHLRRALALLHQPARQHGAGILLEPLVKQGADLLPKIGGMAEAREFIALQRGARSREKELPRGLGFLAVHAALLEDRTVK